MTTAPTSTTFATQQTPIHHAVAFSYNAPTTCGRTEQPKPSAELWDNVTCQACLALRCAYAFAEKPEARCTGVVGHQGKTPHRAQWLRMDGE